MCLKTELKKKTLRSGRNRRPVAMEMFNVFLFSTGVFRSRSTQMEWFDPMDNVTEADYYSFTAAMAAMS